MTLQRKHLLILLPVTVWLVLYSWRPFYLGFYHDDWIVFAFHHAQGPNFSEYLTWLKNRIGFAVSLYCIISIWDGNPFTLHTLFAIGWGVSAVTMFLLVREIITLYGNKNTIFPAAFASALWLGMPWSMGYTAFLACSIISLPCVIGFMICAWSYLRYTQGRKYWYVVVSGAALVFCFINYEAFYISFAGICAISVWLNWRHGTISWRRELIGSTILFSVQAFFIILAKIMTPKTLMVNMELCINNLHAPRTIFMNTMKSVLPEKLVLVLLLCLLVLCVASAWKDWKKNRTLWNTIFALVLLTIVVISLLISTLPYSLAQYGLVDSGCSSRTTLSFSLWLCLGVGILIAAVCQQQSWLETTTKAVFCGFLLVLVIATVECSRNWINVVAQQNAILTRMPMTEISKTSEKTVFILPTDRFLNKVEVFAAPWDISSAMIVRHPELAKSKKWDKESTFTPLYDWHVPRWNGKVLEVLKGYELPALHVYKIDLQAGKLTPYPKTDF